MCVGTLIPGTPVGRSHHHSGRRCFVFLWRGQGTQCPEPEPELRDVLWPARSGWLAGWCGGLATGQGLGPDWRRPEPNRLLRIKSPHLTARGPAWMCRALRHGGGAARRARILETYGDMPCIRIVYAAAVSGARVGDEQPGGGEPSSSSCAGPGSGRASSSHRLLISLVPHCRKLRVVPRGPGA